MVPKHNICYLSCIYLIYISWGEVDSDIPVYCSKKLTQCRTAATLDSLGFYYVLFFYEMLTLTRSKMTEKVSFQIIAP